MAATLELIGAAEDAGETPGATAGSAEGTSETVGEAALAGGASESKVMREFGTAWATSPATEDVHFRVLRVLRVVSLGLTGVPATSATGCAFHFLPLPRPLRLCFRVAPPPVFVGFPPEGSLGERRQSFG